MGFTFKEIVALRETGPNEYETMIVGEQAVPGLRFNYGGWTIAVGIKAASLTMPPRYYIYSVTGNFLGPSRTDRNLIIQVKVLRNTRSFQTRFVEVSQVQDDGSKRLCLVLSADYQAREPETLLVYSAPPGLRFSKPDECPTVPEYIDGYFAKGLIAQSDVDRCRGNDDNFHDYYDQRDCPESAFSQQLLRLRQVFPSAAGVQSDRVITDKRSACWFKNKTPLSAGDQAPSLAFIMDGCLPIVGHTHAGLAVADIGQASSLDFALRVFVNDLTCDDWLLREWSTITGGEGRTYSESRVWDQKGRMLCSMTQQCILRGPKKPVVKL